MPEHPEFIKPHFPVRDDSSLLLGGAEGRVPRQQGGKGNGSPARREGESFVKGAAFIRVIALIRPVI